AMLPKIKAGRFRILEDGNTPGNGGLDQSMNKSKGISFRTRMMKDGTRLMERKAFGDKRGVPPFHRKTVFPERMIFLVKAPCILLRACIIETAPVNKTGLLPQAMTKP